MMRIIQSRSSPALRLSRVAITLLGVLALLGGAALPGGVSPGLNGVVPAIEPTRHRCGWRDT